MRGLRRVKSRPKLNVSKWCKVVEVCCVRDCIRRSRLCRNKKMQWSVSFLLRARTAADNNSCRLIRLDNGPSFIQVYIAIYFCSPDQYWAEYARVEVGTVGEIFRAITLIVTQLRPPEDSCSIFLTTTYET